MPEDSERELHSKAWLDQFLKHHLQLGASTSAFEHAALKPLFLLNGGAIITLLAFVGAIAGEDTSESNCFAVLLFAQGIFAWILGLVSATAAVACGYYSQHSFYKMSGARTTRLRKHYLRDEEAFRQPIDEQNIEKIKQNEATWTDEGYQWREWACNCFVASCAAFIFGAGFEVFAVILLM